MDLHGFQLPNLHKTKAYHFPEIWLTKNNSVLKKDKSAIPPLFNNPDL